MFRNTNTYTHTHICANIKMLQPEKFCENYVLYIHIQTSAQANTHLHSHTYIKTCKHSV